MASFAKETNKDITATAPRDSLRRATKWYRYYANTKMSLSTAFGKRRDNGTRLYECETISDTCPRLIRVSMRILS